MWPRCGPLLLVNPVHHNVCRISVHCCPVGGNSIHSDPFRSAAEAFAPPQATLPLHSCSWSPWGVLASSGLVFVCLCCTHVVIAAAAQHCCSSRETPAGALLDAIAGCTLLNGTPCSGDPADAALAEEAVQCRLMLDSSLAHLGEGSSSLASGFTESMLVPGSQVRLCWLGIWTEHAGARVTGEALLARRVRGC